ncbi:MAG: hypothetical protein ACPL3B_05575 [Fervidobacterium sp.]
MEEKEKERVEMEEDLLISILECGYQDLERLLSVLKLAKKFGISTDDIIDNIEDTGVKIEFNSVIQSAMSLILDRIADEVKDEDVSEKIREYGIYVNYMDSWFGISALDGLDDEDIEKLTTDEIIKGVVEEVSSEQT